MIPEIIKILPQIRFLLLLNKALDYEPIYYKEVWPTVPGIACHQEGN